MTRLLHTSHPARQDTRAVCRYVPNESLMLPLEWNLAKDDLL
jgi:hypothetical protein